MRLRQQILTKNECYITGRTIKPKGVMVHSTGANNPNVSRYVPGDAEMGCSGRPRWNTYHAGGEDTKAHAFVLDPVEKHCKTCGGDQKCVHAFIGKFADGGIGTVQTLPWNWRGWHSGGSSNDTHIGFEICEDGLTDPVYFKAAYQEAVELTAWLCKQYGLDPLEDGVVICHQEGYRRGVASNHADVLHWFPKLGKSMDDFRQDVAEAIKQGKEDDDMDQEKFDQMFAAAMEQYRQGLRDNDSSEWSAKARQWCIDKGIFTGSGTEADGSPNYMWEDLLTREQCAQVLYRFAQESGMV